jgi:two-component system chemotaxis response regulator CheY
MSAQSKVALVVDDSGAMRSILRRLLSELGYEVIGADNGKSALVKLQENPSVCVSLVDWNMPEMNGLELVKAIRGQPQYSEMRILMVTTETEMMQVVKAMEAGANEYVMKPFSGETIAEKLRLMGCAN